ncbi:hypothetical protein AB0L14_36950 [Streptomyces sp. NPDC052727]|uniref:hypothetical protein n=1 Tax=Streptomyces sp. NPDC052727 TaxID=3154854 RepID=UPI003422A510
MTRDNIPTPVQPPDPAPAAQQQPVAGADLSAAITRGAAQGAVRSITDRLVGKFLTNPSEWLRALWHALPKPWE